MKRKLGFLALVLLCVALLPVLAGAETRTGKCGENLTYTLTDDGTLIISGTGNMKDYTLDYQQSPYITSAPWKKTPIYVIIENGVTSIGRNAFYGCTSLKNITLPGSLVSIGESAFNNCTSLNNFTIPENVINIGERAFYYCTSLTNVMIPDGVTNIGKYTFSCCTSLASVVLPESISYIRDQTFSYCHGLKNILIPNSVTSIGNSAFYYCTSLENITIPNSVIMIENGAFFGCTSLTSMVIPDSVTSIGNYAFNDCVNLTNVKLSAKCTSIGNCAFSWCDKLAEITIPNSVSIVGDYAFSYSVSKVYFPDSNVTIGDDAFDSRTVFYCFEFSDADNWAYARGYQTVYLDNMDIEEIRTIMFSQDIVRVAVDESLTVHPDIFPLVDVPELVWSSSAPDIVRVEDGRITGLKAGSSVITVTMGSLSASFTANVSVKASSFRIPDEVWVAARTDYQIPILEVLPVGAEILSFTWTSSDTDIATVNDGKVNGIKPGDVTISVGTDSGLSDTCLVHICYPVTGIAFTEESVSARVGIPAQLTANVTTREQSVVNRLVAFTSSDETIATIDENGVVTGLKPGVVTITATAASGASASCTVTVAEMAFANLPASLKTIEAEAFAGADFEAVLIPDGCEAIGSRAFADCKNLLYVRIPASVTSLADDAFAGCGLVTVDRITE